MQPKIIFLDRNDNIVESTLATKYIYIEINNAGELIETFGTIE